VTTREIERCRRALESAERRLEIGTPLDVVPDPVEFGTERPEIGPSNAANRRDDRQAGLVGAGESIEQIQDRAFDRREPATVEFARRSRR